MYIALAPVQDLDSLAGLGPPRGRISSSDDSSYRRPGGPARAPAGYDRPKPGPGILGRATTRCLPVTCATCLQQIVSESCVAYAVNDIGGVRFDFPQHLGYW